ncbi:MAG: glycosyltransferase family 2 protein [Candidatus Wildermuthbacteria bacterium]|nr:glycosyltransferase family 2 protein [Candidatus Wildermuthbacteria bacterium]
MHLSVIIPSYNEEKRLPKTLKAVDEYLKKQDYDYEILVVNDGSKDKTADVVHEFGASIKNLRFVDNKKNHGKGYVVRQGMLEAKGKYRVFMDADNSTSVDHVGLMWPLFGQGKDIVIGSRDLKESVIPVRQPWWRERLGDIFNLIVQFTSGLWGMWDTQCGFKGFTEKSAVDVFSGAVVDRWAFDVELLVIAKKRGYSIAEIPVTWINDASSKVTLKGMIRMLFEVLQIRLNSMRGMYGKKREEQKTPA